MREYKIISADGHIEVRPEAWTGRVPLKYRDRAPRTVKLPSGGEALMIEGVPLRETQLLDVQAGRSPEQFGPFGMAYDSPGTGPGEQRIKEQDQDGLDAEVLYGGMTAGPAAWRSIRHDEVYHAIVAAYNQWLAEDYCAVDPSRLIGVGIIPLSTLQGALDELEHCARLGLRTVVLGNFPTGLSYPTEEDDKFWIRSMELGIAVSCHPKFNIFNQVLGLPPSGENLAFKYPNPNFSGMVFRQGVVEYIAMSGMPPAGSFAAMICSGVFDRFPDFQFLFAETKVGWIPFWLEHADLWYQRHVGWSQKYLGFKPMKELPSYYVKKNLMFTVINERTGVEARKVIGADHIMFSTDFPHLECEWPNTRKCIEKVYFDVPPDEKYKIMAGNAIRFYKLDAKPASYASAGAGVQANA